MNWQTLRLRVLWCWHQLLTLALVVLVLVAVVVGVGRQFLPELDRYRPRAEAGLSARMGLPVRLAGLQGSWEGMGLKLQLHDLQLRDPAAPDVVLLSVPEVELRPELWQSLRHLEPRVDVRLSGLDIHLDQQEDGSIKLRELAGLAGSNPESAEQALHFALRQPALAVSRSRVGLALRGKPALAFSDIDLVNLNQGDRHQLAGHLSLAGSSETLGLQLELTGDPLHWQHSDLRVWLHLPVVALERWLSLPALADTTALNAPTADTRTPDPAMQADTRGLRTLTGGGDYWLHFRQGRLASVQGRLDWRDVVLDDGQRHHHLQNFKGDLAWSQAGGGWQLAAGNLSGQLDKEAWPVAQLALRGQRGQVELAASRLDLGPALRLAAGLGMPEKFGTWLQAAAPQGRLPSLRAALQQDAQGHWQPQWLDARVDALQARATRDYPGVRGLSGWLRWSPGQAWLGLDSRDAELDLAQFFHERMSLQRLQGNLHLQQQDGVWRLDSDQWQVRNADARGHALFRLTVPAADPGAARLSLLAGLQDARAASAWRYVPWTVASDDTLRWLQHSIQGGQVSRGDFLYDGPVHQRDDLEPHRLQMRFVLHDGRLDYDSHWPELRQLDAELSIDGHRLAVAGKARQVLDGSSASHVLATIEDLHQPVLQIEGDVSSNGADLMRLFRESALRQHAAGLVEALDVQGPLQGRLQLAIPLEGGEPDVEVQAQLAGNRLLLRQADLEVGNVEGSLRYSSEDGLSASGLKARLLEAPVNVDIGSQMRRGQLAAVNVAVDGQADVPALRRWLGSNLLDTAGGTFVYQARVTVPTDASPLRLQLNSSLAGLRLDLPAPLGKNAADIVPLQYQSALGKGEQMARLQYGPHLAAGLVWNGSRLDRALFRLSGSTPAWPQNPGIEVEGSLARLDLGNWVPWLQRFNRSPVTTAAARGEAPLPALTRLNLQVRELQAQGLRLQNAQIGMTRDGDAWKVTLDSDAASGQLLLPDAPAADVRLSFSRLQWPFPGMAPAGARAEAGPSPETVGSNLLVTLGSRPLLVSGEDLKLGNWPGLGPVAINARLLPSPYGLRVEDIAFGSHVLDFKGRLDWQWRGGMRTRLRGTASSGDVAGLLAAAGYAPSLVSPHARAELDLAWPGNPEQPLLAALDGSLALEVEQGRLLTVSNTTSASRVFGWFDLDNIKRRFKGDFSDVLRRGLSFDKASLQGPLQAGVMTQADFLVDGPTLKAEGHGRLDLAQQQMDQQFTVTVPVSSAVPVAAVVMAGPLIGGAVAAAQMAFENQIDKVTQLRYHVSGDWENPRVERLNMKILQGKGSGGVNGGLQPVAGARTGRP